MMVLTMEYVQNPWPQVLAMVAMEPPTIVCNSMRDEVAK